MSIVIKGMDMPTSCSRCPCSNDESRFCRAAEEYVPMLGKPAFCPLVDVPDTNVEDMISRQAAIDALQKEINKGIPPFDDVMGSIRCGVRLARNIIEDMPSAQPEIIRCKDCKYSSPNKVYGCRLERFDTWEDGPRMYSDDFCSRAERRTDDLE